MERQCRACKKESETRLQCSRCKVSFYCGEECQRAHWPKTHRAVCQAICESQRFLREEWLPFARGKQQQRGEQAEKCLRLQEEGRRKGAALEDELSRDLNERGDFLSALDCSAAAQRLFALVFGPDSA